VNQGSSHHKSSGKKVSDQQAHELRREVIEAGDRLQIQGMEKEQRENIEKLI